MHDFDVDKAAREANRVYLTGCSVSGVARELQRYDRLDERGRAVWRSMITSALRVGSST